MVFARSFVFCCLLLAYSVIINGPKTVRCVGARSSEESIEIPVRRRDDGKRSAPAHNNSPQHRPILELVLGILDTLHSSTKAEIKRVKMRLEKNTVVPIAAEPTRTS